MGININGYDLINNAGLKFGASETRVMAAEYGIRDPALPGMSGSAYGGGAYKVCPLPLSYVDVNNGSWSLSTHRFTAPVAGIYYTSFGGITGDGSETQTNGYYGIIVNGAAWYFGYRDTISIWELMHVEGMVKLEAGDTVMWSMNAAPGPATGSAGGAYQTNHNMCCIWLVG